MTLWMILTFVLGYLLIAFEQVARINKAAIALIAGVICWTIYMAGSANEVSTNAMLMEHTAEIAGILFFLMGAMTVVELIDAHDGFNIITDRITQTRKSSLLWIVAGIGFFLSALLDNLTTTIVLVSLIGKLVSDKEDRFIFCGVTILAANAGGAWSPIGDITTTMLWMGHQLTTIRIVMAVFIPSAVSVVVPLLLLTIRMKGHISRPTMVPGRSSTLTRAQQAVVLFAGLGILVMVPVFKTLTGLPPYMGMLLGLGLLWLLTEILHGGKDEEDKHLLSVNNALKKIDTPSVLFFFGILMCIAGLQSAGVLNATALWLKTSMRSDELIVFILGLVSSVIDNVPLVAAIQGMYPLSIYPTDHPFWEFLAYCSGIGGSLLIIGSAAGVAAMGLEKISFFWYLRRFTLLAFLGYLAGAGTYILLNGGF